MRKWNKENQINNSGLVSIHLFVDEYNKYHLDVNIDPKCPSSTITQLLFLMNSGQLATDIVLNIKDKDFADKVALELKDSLNKYYQSLYKNLKKSSPVVPPSQVLTMGIVNEDS